jgi:ABC-type transport system substrate-binding protein
LEYERFDGYWRGKPYLDGLKFIFIKDPVTGQMAFQAEQGDVLSVTNPSIANDLVEMGYRKESRPGPLMALIPDSAHPDSVYADKRVREAIEYAIDRQKLAKAVGQGLFEPVNQPAAGHHFGHIDIEGRSYDPEKARQLLAEAGYPDGFKTTIISPSAFNMDALQSIQSFLGKVGIDVKLDIVSFGKWVQHVYTGWKNALVFTTQGATDANYCAFLERYYSAAAARYKNSLARPEGLDELVRQALRATDYETQKALSQKAVRMLVDDATSISLYVSPAIYILHKNVHDTGFDQLGGAGFRWSVNTAWMSK